MNSFPNALLPLLVFVLVACKSKSTENRVAGAPNQQVGKHLEIPQKEFQYNVSCTFNVRQGDIPPQWQSAPDIAGARKQVELVLNKLGRLAEHKVCVDFFLKEKNRSLKFDSKNCAARECPPPVTGLQQLSKTADAKVQDGNFVSRTTIYFNDKTRGEKEQTSITISESKVPLTWRITDDISRPDFRVDGKELNAWARQNSGKICASIRRSVEAGLNREQVFHALSDDFRALGLDDQEAGIVGELVSDENCRWP